MSGAVRRLQERPFGLHHPTWSAPTNFFYATAEEAWDAIERVYGLDRGHVVVHAVVLPNTPTPDPATPTRAETPADRQETSK